MYITVGVGIQKITNTRGEVVMTRVTRVAYTTVGVGDLKITNASDGIGELILKWFSVRDFQWYIVGIPRHWW